MVRSRLEEGGNKRALEIARCRWLKTSVEDRSLPDALVFAGADAPSRGVLTLGAAAAVVVPRSDRRADVLGCDVIR